MIKIFTMKAMMIIGILAASCSVSAMQRASNSRPQRIEINFSKEQIINHINIANNESSEHSAGRALANVLIGSEASWAWRLFYKLIESPGFNEFDSLSRASKRNIGSWTLAYLNRYGWTRDYTLSLLNGPDFEENLAALRAIVYGDRLECSWAQSDLAIHQEKASFLVPAFQILVSRQDAFVPTCDLLNLPKER